MKPGRHQDSSALVDLAVILGLSIVAYLASISLDLFDHVLDWLHLYEEYEVDELLAAVVILPLSLTAFSLRRWQDLRRALQARQAAEQRLAESARLEGVLLAVRTMQHQMNNQLGVAVGYAEMLVDDSTLGVEQQEIAQAILSGTEQAAAILEQMRGISQVQVQNVGAPGGPVLGLEPRQSGRSAAA